MSTATEIDVGLEASQGGALPVMEIFGPTVQGEGPEAGRPAYFVRFGGCDFRCSWCDTMYAVEPSEVRANAELLTAAQVVERLQALPDGPRYVVLTGGNPALLELGSLVDELHAKGYEAAVETQGSKWREWLRAADRLVVSPKPPSSGMATGRHLKQFQDFMAEAISQPATVLKIAIFDDVDLEWAEQVHADHANVALFLSVGTDQNLPEDRVHEHIGLRFRWLAEEVARRPNLSDVRVMPQLHVIAWGTVRGV